MARYLYIAIVVAVSGLAGCAATAKQSASDGRKEMDQLRQRNRQLARHVRALEDRVFVLEDKLDTVQIEASRSSDAVPKLPVVRKEVAEVTNSDSGSDSDAIPTYSDEGYTHSNGLYDQQVEVVYEGEAAADSAAPSVTYRNNTQRQSRNEVAAQPKARRRPKARSRTMPTNTRDFGQGELPSSAKKLGVVPMPGKSKPKARDTGTTDTPVSSYKTAFSALKRREHDVAVSQFQDFLRRWPNHEYADNSQYWLAEAFYDRRKFESALSEFRRVVERYPNGNKAPDALLKIGYCYVQLGDKTSAGDVWKQVVDIYPKTNAARLAAERLQELSKD